MNPKLKFEPVRLSSRGLLLIDQRKLPGRFIYVLVETDGELAYAIREMIVRGAPAIGIAGAYGVYLGARRLKVNNRDGFVKRLKLICRSLKSVRPTAVNLSWAVDRVFKAAANSSTSSVHGLTALILREARKIHEEDIAKCFAMARYGSALIQNGDSILTHCNAGGLATSGYGTALGVLFEAKRQGRRFHVYVDETRPVLQGARLTAWELKRYRIPFTLICDNMAGSLMRNGRISKVITGADRIVRNGDTANKIGTYSVACLARAHQIPFYVAAPSSTFDLNRSRGAEIPIEERSPAEITDKFKMPIAPAGAKMFNPAFDVTPHKLIAAFITEKGILKPPFERSFRKLAR